MNYFTLFGIVLRRIALASLIAVQFWTQIGVEILLGFIEVWTICPRDLGGEVILISAVRRFMYCGIFKNLSYMSWLNNITSLSLFFLKLCQVT